MTYLFVAVLLVMLISVVLIFKLSASISGLPVLNYHKTSSGNQPDFLTVTAAQLRQHFEYLNKKGYTTIFISDLLANIEQQKPLPRKPVMITLDDGYRDNYTCLYPLLKEYGIRANIFLVAGFIQSPDGRHTAPNPMGEFMHVQEAMEMSKDMVEFGLHTFSHQSYSKLSLTEIDADVTKTKDRLKELGIPVQPCHAYTFGAYNQKDENKRAGMFALLKQHNIRLAFRVSNWVDKLPVKNKLYVSRIHVSGLFPFWKFKVSVWGFIKVFNRFEKILK